MLNWWLEKTMIDLNLLFGTNFIKTLERRGEN